MAGAVAPGGDPTIEARVDGDTLKGMHTPAMYDPATVLAVASDSAGPGWLLRTVILVSVLGVAFLAWFLLRGYGSKD